MLESGGRNSRGYSRSSTATETGDKRNKNGHGDISDGSTKEHSYLSTETKKASDNTTTASGNTGGDNSKFIPSSSTSLTAAG